MKKSNDKYTGKGYSTYDWKITLKTLNDLPYDERLDALYRLFGKEEERIRIEILRHEVILPLNEIIKKYYDGDLMEDYIVTKVVIEDTIAAFPAHIRSRYCLYYMGYSIREIAKYEGVQRDCVSKSIKKAKIEIEKNLENI